MCSLFSKTRNHKVQISKWCQNTLGTLWRSLNSNQNRLTRLDLGFVSVWTELSSRHNIFSPRPYLHLGLTHDRKTLARWRDVTQVPWQDMHIWVGQQAFELGQNHTSTCSIACSSARPRTGCPLRAPCTVGPCPPRLCPAMPKGAYKYLGCATVCSSLRLTPRAKTPTPASSPPPAITARAKPPWTALPDDPKPRPSHWTASPWSGEAFPSLSRGIASPEK
jgi:hypothetical protein